MSVELLVNVTPSETRVALVENGLLQEVHVERQAKRGIVGNIYKGKISRVLPGMQAAFVDIGEEKAAFLYVGDVLFDPDVTRHQFDLTEGEHDEDVNEVPEENDHDVPAPSPSSPNPEGSVAAAAPAETAAAPEGSAPVEPVAGAEVVQAAVADAQATPSGAEVVEAAHPVPDAAGEAAARRLLELVRGLTTHDLVLCLISGGGSSLLPLALPGLTLADKQALNRALLASGASITEMNCVRRHLSAIKGGRLAAACAPARVVNLLLSDVPGDDPIDIASGPTVADPTTCADAMNILRRYEIDVPPRALHLLASGEGETLKPGDPRPQNQHLRRRGTGQHCPLWQNGHADCSGC